MSTIVWQAVKQIHCERIDADVSLVEKRIYPADLLQMGQPEVFRVDARVCSWAKECAVRGCPCRWTGINPDYDPFEA